MTVDKGNRTFGNGVIAIEMELTSGTWYTLWAPNWIVRGESWQAFLGDDDHVFAFSSPAKLLAYLNEGGRNDLNQHNKWNDFAKNLADNVIPTERTTISLVEVPRQLAQRPSTAATLAVTCGFDLLRSFGTVLDIAEINHWFHSYSILNNTRRGADHYHSENGQIEWTGVGSTVLEKWNSLTAAILPFLKEPAVSETAVAKAQEDIDAALAARKAKQEAEAEQARKAKESAAANAALNPYDETLWAASGIDPIRVSLNGQYVYTLRTYVGDKAVFLGHMGEIFTFPNSKSLVRWIIDAPEHDLETLSTWGDLVAAANGGELEVKVAPENEYAFGGLRDDIAKGVDAVDSEQLGRAYELLADAADWAKDDAVNKTLLAYPRLQEYLSYMLGAPSTSTPTSPFDEEVTGWKALEDGLIRRFSKF